MEADADGARSRTTLAHVAARAGVSLKTASRALGGESHVKQETLARVLEAARALDYQRNAAASLLASRRLADSIGLVTGDFTNPFYSALAQAIEDEIRTEGMHLSVANARESAVQERRVAHDLADRQTKALLVVSSMQDHSDYAALQARGIPVVFVDRPASGIEADSVVFDDRESGRLAARHLSAGGHRRIAFIGDYSWLPTHRERVAGLGDVLDATGDTWRRLLRTDAHDVEAARTHAAELLALPDPPTAIVAGNNRILLGVLEARRNAGAVPPAVLGFDAPEWAEVLGISVIAGDVEAMGRRAARLALMRLSDRSRSIENAVLPVRLTARASTR
ncbi:LacI family DNA-binding transcriptional regulator [Luethyella okanaganae]|uniref:LacI family DNA-binding transcriptional regulator n=1 Tax=Luethyella okanaganae TaxID=69372 RepID=A0ABW1VGA0_9MICO